MTSSLNQKALYKKLNFILNKPDMFTGIIQNLGKIVDIQSTPEGKRFWIKSDMPVENYSLGNSIAVDGVCLTVEAAKGDTFQATVVPETLELTTLSGFEIGTLVNLEAPLTLQTPIAGHLVSGHVDGIGDVVQAESDYRILVPQKLSKYLAKKGSVTINGTSLTIAEMDGLELRIALIPETLERTNLGSATQVNLEVDLMARYLERLTQEK